MFTGKMVTLFFVMMIVSWSFASYFEKRKKAKLKNIFVIITLIEGIYFILAGLYMSSGQRKFEIRLIVIGAILLYMCIRVLCGKEKAVIWRSDLTECEDTQGQCLDTNEKSYGYGSKFFYGLHLNLVTTNQYFKFNGFTSKEYKWTEVLACYKTTFLINTLEKLVIITTDGRYFTIQGSIGELPYFKEQIKIVTNTGGIAFNELFSRFHEAAIIKHVANPLKICNWDAFFYTILFLAFFVFDDLTKGPSKMTMPIMMILIALLAYELYCILVMKKYVKKLCKFHASMNIGSKLGNQKRGIMTVAEQATSKPGP